MARQQTPESVFAIIAHLRHEGEVIGFRLDGIGHETALLDQKREKEKPFANGRAAQEMRGKNGRTF